MQFFTIKDIENLSGIKAHTLRIWEQRYNLVVSQRKESKHRFYDNEDLKTILRIAYLYQNGFKISKIAKLSKEALYTFAQIETTHTQQAESYITQLLVAAIDFDEIKFEQILHTSILQFGFDKCIVEIAYGLLNRIGLLWLTDHLIPAQEHFVSNLISNKIIVATEGLSNIAKDTETETLLFTPRGEYHEIPLLFARYLFKKHGRSVCYMGSNIAADELAYCVDNRKITHLYFHIITNLSGKTLNEVVQELLNKFPKQKLVISGVLAKGITISSDNLTLLKSLEAMLAYPESMDG